jgi:NADPH-ferrihemoprotein reductase
MKPKSIDLEDFTVEDLADTNLVVLLMATFGEGEPTDNAITFWEQLTTEEHDDDRFGNTTFAVFALGNRQYEQFCTIGKKAHKIISKHGGTALLDCGIGDDDGSIDNDFAEWKTRFWDVVKEQYGLQEDDTEKEIDVPFTVNYIRHPQDPAHDPSTAIDYKTAAASIKTGVEGFLPDEKFKAPLRPRLVTITENRELRADTFEGNTRHLELELPSSLVYKTADNLGVFSHNDYKLTGKIIKRFGLHPKTIVSIAGKAVSFRSIFPEKTTVQDALLWYCDFTSVPRSTAIKAVAFYCTDPVEKANLKAYATDADKKEQFTQVDKKNWLELLEEFPSLKLPFDVFLHIVPKLSPYPRYYTIASSAKMHPRSVHITVTVGPTLLPNDRVYNGICSTYMLNEHKNKQMMAFVKASTFRLPAATTPVIMFGPGTGVAPFRAFWQEARWLRESGTEVQDWHLFFGCRYQDKDWIYREEMSELKELGITTHLAFSRDQKEKVYVQDLLQEETTGAHMWDLISNRNAHVYVCGASAMGRSVKDALIAVAQARGGLSAADADAYIKRMIDGKTYIQELWS